MLSPCFLDFSDFDLITVDHPLFLNHLHLVSRILNSFIFLLPQWLCFPNLFVYSSLQHFTLDFLVLFYMKFLPSDVIQSHSIKCHLYTANLKFISPSHTLLLKFKLISTTPYSAFHLRCLHFIHVYMPQTELLTLLPRIFTPYLLGPHLNGCCLHLSICSGQKPQVFYDSSLVFMPSI